MSNNIKMTQQNFSKSTISKLSKKSVLIIGSGKMAEHYAYGLNKLKINNVTIIGNSKKNVEKLCAKFNYQPLHGGFKKNLSSQSSKDLVIICTPIQFLVQVAENALKNKQKNLLIEKPGSLYSNDLKKLNHIKTNQKIRIAYNRLLYPSFLKLRQILSDKEQITSCHFSFSEWIDKINFKNYSREVLDRWGISNSTHVLSMVFSLLGWPKQISCYNTGKLRWHKSGSIFTGSGISQKNIPFSYHSNWNSAGRWGIDIMTEKNIYRLMPLEELSVCKRNATNWTTIPIESPFSNTKPGVCEEIISMLNPQTEKTSKLFSLEDASKLISISEKIFGYKKNVI